MKKLLIPLALVVCVSLVVILQPKPEVTVTESEPVKVESQTTQKLQEIAKLNGLKTKTSPQDHSDHDHSSHDDKHHTDFDFSQYLTKEQKEELYAVTNRSHKGLEVEVLDDGSEVVDLKRRFSHAHVSVIDENGVKRTGEYAQITPVQ